jgi:DDE superfamily endonuclease
MGLVAGAVLAPGKRTVAQALRVMGLGEEPQFHRYHEVLGRSRRDARAVARRLLLHVLDRLLGPVVISIDDTIERRWGAPSRRAASIATRCGPRRGTSSKPMGYAGSH